MNVDEEFEFLFHLRSSAKSAAKLFLFHLPLNFHSSSKKSASTTFPGYRLFGGVFTSTIAQSGSLGTCLALFRSSYSRYVNPLFSTTYFFGFSGFGKIRIGT